MKKGKILVVDDDHLITTMVEKVLSAAGMHVVSCGDCESALTTINESFSAVLMDLSLPRMDGILGIMAIKDQFPDMPCLVISAEEDVRRAVASMSAGASDYLRKPIDHEELVMRVHHAIETVRASIENQVFRNSMNQSDAEESWIGVSPKSLHVLERARQIANSDATVLITGETGTGKSLLARYIHSISALSDKPFVSASIASLPANLIESELFGHEKGAFTGAACEKPGRVEIAKDGTIFMDEIGEMPLSLQPKILRVLQEREFERVGGTQTHKMSARVIACTNRDLRRMCETGRFRQDLYFRVSVLPIEIPPLRERPDDIEALIDRFIAHLSAKTGQGKSLTPDARNALLKYHWPGNVRELQNVLECAFTLSPGASIPSNQLNFLFDSPAEIVASTSLAGRTLAEIEKLAIEQTLDSCDGNKAHAARTLGISEKSIYNKMSRAGLR
ncbi:MAG: sigma-54-dependent Fis family transcriptional regulator [Kiritimatiellales bacterium]|nr:sigma-54-dependent Fis family transcriptional regulator [Kiritimatiellota bacterium]MBL7012199.1 sigma-54-dependent Fis family transcriptional regulator [Kiritimatiellales bacterium]